MSWVQFAVQTDSEHAEALALLFELAGAESVSLVDAASEMLIEPVPGTSPIWKQVRLIALFPDDTPAGPLRQSIQESFPGLQLVLEVEPLPERDWSTTWRDTFNPMSFGAHLWVCPTNAECPQPDAVVVRLDPGAAFGTGTHPTTAMCLEWLGNHPPAGETVLDYGCGSGILAIAAGKLGADRVDAVDIDPGAVAATQENAHMNELDRDFAVWLPETYPGAAVTLLIANILANPLQELAPLLCEYLQPGGTILLTGILAPQAEAVQAAYREWIDFAPLTQRAEWVLLSGIRRTTG